MGSRGKQVFIVFFFWGSTIEDLEGQQFLILATRIDGSTEAIGIGAFHRTWRVTSHMPWTSRRAMPPEMVRCPPSPCPRLLVWRFVNLAVD